ncbi:MAG: TrkH family potassium uptake protein [Clostridiales bacterium]|nr:TrkH family potassium uptake protein [Clostridiales bacterium]
MNKRIITYILGWVLVFEGAAMQIGTVTSLFYGEKEGIYFLCVGIACEILGVTAIKFKRQKNQVLYQRSGFAATALSWILMSLVGCLPFWLSGEIPTFIDALFETVSGITTTGSSVVANVEGLSHCMLIWRSFLNWLGGMGVIVFLLALIPKLGGQQNIYLMKAESPGPIIGKALPRMRSYASLLYGIYIGLTVLEFILLLFGGLGIFDAVNVSFATAGTGGFGIHNSGMAAYDSYYVQMIITVFMLLFGINFTFYILLIFRKFKQAFKIEELWVYLGIIAASVAVIAFNISHLYPTAYDAFNQSFFYVVSVISTTGFGLSDVNAWPELSKAIILILTFVGAMAGSTGGGFKVSRIIILIKEVKKEFALLVHPKNIKAVKMDDKTVNHETVRTTSVYLIVYLSIFILSFLLIAVDNKDFTTSFTSVAASLNNTGPGLGEVGPAGNYSGFSIFSKLVFIFDMLAGRLELFPLLLLFKPSAWKKS